MHPFLAADDNMIREVEHVHSTWTLPVVIDHALEAYRMITRTWVQGSYLLCPWWIWRECDDGVLRFNLLGLVAYSYGWTPSPDAAPLHVALNEHSRRNRRISRDIFDEVLWKLGINYKSQIHHFAHAIDAVRRGDYNLAGDLYYPQHRSLHLGRTSGRRVYLLGDESAADPDFLISRLRRDLPRLGPVDMGQLRRV